MIEEPHEKISEIVCVLEQGRQPVLIGQQDGAETGGMDINVSDGQHKYLNITFYAG